MKREGYKAIFDMDGTLYRFDRGKGQIFTSSQFSRDLRNITYGFIVTKQGVGREQAINRYERIKEKYFGDIGLCQVPLLVHTHSLTAI